MGKTYTREELDSLISKVESDFSAHLAKAEEELKTMKLAKAEEDEAKVEEKEVKDESAEKPEVKEEDKKEEEEKEDDRPYDEEDLELLHKLYSSMSDSEKELHKAALEKCMEKEEAEPLEMAKSEEKAVEAEKLMKSEIDGLKKENEDLKKSLESLIVTLNKKFAKPAAVTAPARKAITELAVLDKSEKEAPKLSHKEIVKKLTVAARGADLKKSDRDAINKYCVGAGTLDSIQHLLN